MTRMALWTVLIAGLGGSLLGWMMFGTVQTTISTPAQLSVEEPDAIHLLKTHLDLPLQRQEFPLLQADIASIREAPSLALAPDGTVVLAWASQTSDSERTLFLARSTDDGKTFNTPVAWRVVPTYAWQVDHGGRAMLHSTHVLPRLASGPEALYLGWVEAEPGGPSATFFVARSTNGGATFEEPIPAHGSASPRPGFTALAVAPEGDVLATWIDNRNGVQQPYFSRWPAGSEGFEPEQLVHAGPEGKGICPCCDNAVIAAPDGSAVVAFRNGDSGQRDIWLARATPGESFADPIQVAPNRAWIFQGCPHDGPALAVSGDRIFSAWMDASSGFERVAYAISESGMAELAFLKAQEIHPESTGSQGHPTLYASPTNAIFAAWEEDLGASETESESESEAGGRAILLASCNPSDSDKGFSTPVATAARPGAYQTHPSLCVSRDGAVLIAFNELDETGKRIVITRFDPAPSSASDLAGR